MCDVVFISAMWSSLVARARAKLTVLRSLGLGSHWSVCSEERVMRSSLVLARCRCCGGVWSTASNEEGEAWHAEAGVKSDMEEWEDRANERNRFVTEDLQESSMCF